MASFKYEGKTYFCSNGKWSDSVLKPITGKLAEKLTEGFEKKKREEKPKVEKKISTVTHRKAKEIEYEETEELTEEQLKALKILESGRNVFLSGEAGTGKSFVLKEFLYRNRLKNIVVCAPTGVAAIKIGGTTVHRAFKVPTSFVKPDEYNRFPGEEIVNADIIVIDEISMCRLDVFEYIIKTIRKAEESHKPKQIIVAGDFFQLPPVFTNSDFNIMKEYWDISYHGRGFAFNSRYWDQLNFKNVILKQIVRQQDNSAFVSNLNKIRKGDHSAISWFNENCKHELIHGGIYLCGKNDTANQYNKKQAYKLPGETVVYDSQVSGQVEDTDKLTQDELFLKVGMQVMTLVNNYNEGYQNGSIGKITALDEDSVQVKLNTGKHVTVTPYEWEIIGYELKEKKLERVVLGTFRQLPLKMAYAITIHKSQGETYSSVNLDPDCFADGQLYVALSRVKTIDQLSLVHDIDESALRTAIEVKSFYNNLTEA